VVGSRVLIGVSAWLLGALTATGGSLLAVDQLGQGLLEQHTKQVSVAMVNAELENSQRTSQAPAASQSAATAPAAAAKMPDAPHRAKAAHAKKSAPPTTREASKLLTSPGGTAVATCANGRARLRYWSPGQGFAVFRVKPGPSSVASVTFTGSSGGFVMRVACGASGVPAAHVSAFHAGRELQHDE